MPARTLCCQDIVAGLCPEPGLTVRTRILQHVFLLRNTDKAFRCLFVLEIILCCFDSLFGTSESAHISHGQPRMKLFSKIQSLPVSMSFSPHSYPPICSPQFTAMSLPSNNYRKPCCYDFFKSGFWIRSQFLAR